MNKPKKMKREYYDYNECRDFLQEKYGYDERDYAGKFKKKNKADESVPYLDFWHWVIEKYEIHNGCVIGFEKSEIEYIEEEWVKRIYTDYINEFADKNGELEMYVSW